jgi:ubiquinone/menaquinone biosynthesis C-methylase UbiE
MNDITYKNAVRKHYGRDGLASAIVKAFEAQGKKIEEITRDDLRALDEFHIRGRKATQELAQKAGLQSGMKVLDLGCGIGGPARTLAAEFGCRVTGLDIMEEYCEAATLLTHYLGLSDKVAFECADVSRLPCDDAAYDAVWSQHVLANIADKRAILREVHRVLRPGGTYAFYEVCAGANEPPYYPMPWASGAEIHFAVRTELLRAQMTETFREIEWQDVSTVSLSWYKHLVSASSSGKEAAKPALGMDLLMGSTAALKMENVVRNLEEDRIRVVQGIMSRAL